MRMMRTGWHHYCFLCVLVCAILKLTRAITNCTVTNNQTSIYQITCHVSENVPPNTLVFDAKEDDRFTDTNNLAFQVHVTGFESAFIQHFVVNNNEVPWVLDDGELRTRGDFDREEMFSALSDSQNHRDTITWAPLLVIRRNGGGVWRFQLHIKVVDVNDNTPTFSTSATVIESDEGDSHNVNLSQFLLSAVDNDERHNSVQDYTLQDDYGGLFTLVVRVGLVEDSVHLESTSPLDHETQSRYDLIMIARDGGNKTGTLKVTLIVVDVNDTDNPPLVEMPPVVIQENLISGPLVEMPPVIIQENLISGHPVIDINGTDVDGNSTLTYSMRVQSNEAKDITGIFVINQTTGEIRTNRVLDRELVSTYCLIVTLRDGGKSSNSVGVLVNVEVSDINDSHPQVNIELIGGKVCDNTAVGTLIATMSVSDPDEGANGMFTVGALVDLDVVDGSQSQIELQQSPQNNKWDLVVASSLNIKTRPHYNFEITVVDHGSPPLSTTKMFSFSLQDCSA